MSNPQSGRETSSSHHEIQMPFSPAEMMGLWTPMLAGMRIWNGAFGKTVAALNNEWLDFVHQRLHDDFSLPQQLASCKSVEAIWRVYGDFCQRCIDDYQKEFTELARLGNTAIGQGMNVMQSGGDQGLNPTKRRMSPH